MTITLLTIYLLYLLFSFGIAPNLRTFFPTHNFDGYETSGINLQIHYRDWEEDDTLLERLHFFYYDILLATDSLESVARGMGQPLHVGGIQFQVEKFDQNSFNWFGQELDILEGRNFVNEDFATFRGYFPVLLGHDFSGVNEIGDTFTGVYFGFYLEFEVIGILAENQVKSQEWLQRRLDATIVLPFVSHRYIPEDANERQFWIEMYSILANSLLIIENTPDTIDYVINAINTGATEIRIPYTLGNIDLNVPETIEIRNLVRHQQEIMMFLFFSVAIVLFTIITIFMSIKYRVRERIYYTFMLNGKQKWKILLVIFAEVSLLFTGVYLIFYEYLAFHSGFFWDTNILGYSNIFFEEFNNLTRWNWFYRNIWNENNAMLYLLLYVILLCIVSMIYPILKINKLYKKGR